VTDRLKIPWAAGAPLTSPSRRLFLSPVGLALLGGTLLAVSLKLVDWTAELLWFRTFGYENVFWRLRLAEVAMFAVAFVPVFVYVLLNLLVLARLADLESLLRGGSPAGMSQSWPNHSRPGVAQSNPQRLTPLLILGSAATAAIFGFACSGEWDRFLRLVWAQDFGTSDPIYLRDIGFYLFVLPFLNLVQISLVLLTLGGTLMLGLAYLWTGDLRFFNRLRAFLADQGAILNAIRDEHPDGAKQKRLIARSLQIAEGLPAMPSDQTRAMLIALLSRVDLKPDRVEIKMRWRRLVELLQAQSTEATTQGSTSDKESEDVLTLTVKARLQRVGREMRMLVENSDQKTSADPGLLRVIARAHDIHEHLMQSTGLTLRAIGSKERITPGYISRLLRLPLLAPDIVTAIVNGKNPPQLTAKKLMRLALEIPIDWTEQRKLLGFHPI